MASLRRTMFTFSRADVARAVADMARERECTVPDIINEALVAFVSEDGRAAREMLAEMVRSQAQLIRMLEEARAAAAPAVRPAPRVSLESPIGRPAPLPVPDFTNMWEK